MNSSLLRRSQSVEEKVKPHQSSESNGSLNTISESSASDTEKSTDLKLKEMPLVHQAKKKVTRNESTGSSTSTEVEDSWVLGGTLGSRGATLQFRCSALSNPPVDPPANELHMTYKTIQAETKLLTAVLTSHGMREVHQNIPDFNLLWTGMHPKPQLLKALTPYQRVNHFPRSYELTRKDRLYKNIERMQYAKGVKHFDFIPQTFVMPMDFRELCTTHYRHKGPWIVKPVASSRGRGIYIVNSPDQVPLEETLVVAKYIDNPLLVSGHKCDLRLYVAVTCYDPLIVYMYEEGLVRFATVKYDSSGKHLWNPCMHLCNYSINKYHSDYIKSEDPDAEDVGHKWTLSALLRHLRTQDIDTSLLMQRIEEVVVKSILASSSPIVSACRMFVPHTRNCFELYGFDILIDSSLKPWLLEVNLSPSLGCDSPLDVRVKSAMLVDLLTLVGVPIVDPMLRRVNETRRPMGQLEILRKLSCRRVQSADTLTGSKKMSTRLVSSTLTLSPEESRIVKMARAEFDRRGGFVRIFPSPESWKRYGSFLDPTTGIMCTAASGTGTHSVLPPMVVPHNYNLLLHQQLFPDLQAPFSTKVGPLRKAPSSPDRLSRYERALMQGHKASLDERQIDRAESVPPETADEPHPGKDVKQKMLDCLESGSRLSQFQARRIFAQYLGCILRRVANQGKGISGVDISHGELILRFLQKASTNLRTPYFVQVPSRKLSGKDRLAVVAKQLNDFIYLYNRETELYTEVGDKPTFVPSRLFQSFLVSAKETELEDVLAAQTQLYNCAHLYLGRCGPGPGGQKPLSLLRSIPHPDRSQPNRGDCECQRRTLPRVGKDSHAPRGQSGTPAPPSTAPNKRQSLKVSRAL